MRRHRFSDEQGKQASWMDTYGDMVTLLLTFFVMLFSMSNLDAAKFRQAALSIQGALGIKYQGPTISNELNVTDYPEESIEDIDAILGEIEDMEKIYTQMKEYIEINRLGNYIEISKEQPGVLIRFKDNILFDSGKADIKDDSKQILSYIVDILNEFNKDIRVEGHTDNVPINNFMFPSNWELSTQRAVNVIKYFIEEKTISPLKLSAVGYGEYHPISDNSTIAGRQANRRVDIVILKTNVEEEISVKEEEDLNDE